MSKEATNHRLTRSGERDVRFEGVLLAEVSNRSHQGPFQNRWTEIDVYRTVAGKFVCQVTQRSLWVNEADHFEVYVRDRLDELVDVLGYGALAKELYDDLGVDASEEVA